MYSRALMNKWALVLGASSGFGAATCRALADRGMNIFGVHMDRKATMPQVRALVTSLRKQGVEVHFFNVNAVDPKKRAHVLDEIGKTLGEGGGLHVLLHSIAFGALRPYFPEEGEELSKVQMEMTCDAMGHSLVYWVQDIVRRGLFAKNSRVFAMTSAGASRVMPSYGAVSAAKAVLESHIRQLAMELGPKGITVNAIRAGVTDTPALRKIPGNEKIIDLALARNPMGRLTLPDDVGEAIAVLSEPGAYWITGNVIGVDGGEDIVG